jgi:secreted trypsin-like serine protease
MKFLVVAALVCLSSTAYGKSLIGKTRYSPKELFTNGNGRIVGGTNAAPGEFPYQVSYQIIKDGKGPRHACGGSIINAEWIMCAAHCVDPTICEGCTDHQIVAGINQLSDTGATRQQIKIAKIISHPQWNKEQLINDIALLKLETPLTLNDLVKPTKLPSANYVPSGELTVSGWGLLEQDDPAGVPDNLQKVNMPHYEFEMCKMIFQILGLEIQACHTCAGGYGEAEGVCNGDSGGPLVAQDGTQVGIVSFGLGCGSPYFPAVFGSVPNFISWIESTISSN